LIKRQRRLEAEEEANNDPDVCQLCDGPDKEGFELIQCYTEDATIEGCEKWFHYKCCGLGEIPEGDWLCQECANRQQKDIVVGLEGMELLDGHEGEEEANEEEADKEGAGTAKTTRDEEEADETEITRDSSHEDDSDFKPSNNEHQSKKRQRQKSSRKNSDGDSSDNYESSDSDISSDDEELQPPPKKKPSQSP
jgi:PHD-finger